MTRSVSGSAPDASAERSPVGASEISSDQQLALWLQGQPIHRGDKETGECCPDFSCCRPELLAPETERRTYVEHPVTRDFMRMGFLTRAVSTVRRKIHIAGGEQGEA